MKGFFTFINSRQHIKDKAKKALDQRYQDDPYPYIRTLVRVIRVP